MKMLKLWCISGIALIIGAILTITIERFADVFFLLAWVTIWLPLAYAKDFLKDTDVKIDWKK